LRGNPVEAALSRKVGSSPDGGGGRTLKEERAPANEKEGGIMANKCLSPPGPGSIEQAIIRGKKKQRFA